MSNPALEEFARHLAAEVEEGKESEDGESFSEAQFTKLVLEKLSDEGVLENPVFLWQAGTFQRTRYKITGFAQSEDDERILLTSTIYTGEIPPRALTRDEIITAANLAMSFYRCSCEGLHGHIDPAKTEASELAQHISEVHEKIGVLRLVLISDGLIGLPSLDVKEAFDGTRIIVDKFGIEELYRILGEGLTRDDIVLDFKSQTGKALSCLKASSEDTGYDAYLTAIPGAVLADVYEKYGTRLLELNVRAFLGVRGRKTVNAGLRQTIREQPNRFLAYNNGIVATVDHIDLESDTSGNVAVLSVKGLQIVNGGQTTASLHRAKKQDSANLDGIMVPAKIIKVKGENLDEMVMAISRSANSQNTVQPADFSANEPFHVAVEELASNNWLLDGKSRWFYERARGSYGAAELRASFKASEKRRFASETPKSRRFSKTDLAKYLNAWAGLPYYVSSGNQKNFQQFMQSMKEEYPNGYRPDQNWFRAFIGKAIIFRAVQAIVKIKQFPAYQSIIVAYTVALLAKRTGGQIDFDVLWSQQAISPQLRSMIEGWVSTVDEALRQTAEGRMPTEWAKKEACWTAIQKIQLNIPETLPPEIVRLSREYASTEDKVISDPAVQEERDDSRDELIVQLRHLFNGGGGKDREALISELARQSGNERTGARIREEMSGIIRTAVRRGILKNHGGELTVATRNIADYDREFLKTQFLASMSLRVWTERDDAIRDFARWLGFRRTGAYIDETARSVINGLIREQRLQSNGSTIRRA